VRKVCPSKSLKGLGRDLVSTEKHKSHRRMMLDVGADLVKMLAKADAS